MEYLAGDGGHVSSQRTVGRGREGGPAKLRFTNVDPSIKSRVCAQVTSWWALYASHFMVDIDIISAIFERHGGRYSKARTLAQTTSETTPKGGAASPRPVAARGAARRGRSAEDELSGRPRDAAGATALCAGTCDASGRSKASASERAALSGPGEVDCAGAGALWDAGPPLVGAERAPTPDRRGDAPTLAFAGDAGALDSHEQGAQQGP